MNRRLILAGAALVAVSFFLPWISVRVEPDSFRSTMEMLGGGFTLYFSGRELSDLSLLLLLVPAFAIASTLVGHRAGRLSRALLVVIWLAGIGSQIVGTRNLRDVDPVKLDAALARNVKVLSRLPLVEQARLALRTMTPAQRDQVIQDYTERLGGESRVDEIRQEMYNLGIETDIKLGIGFFGSLAGFALLIAAIVAREEL